LRLALVVVFSSVLTSGQAQMSSFGWFSRSVHTRTPDRLAIGASSTMSLGSASLSGWLLGRVLK
jgi:hypothetical protein